MSLLLWSGGCDSTCLLHAMLESKKTGKEIAGVKIGKDEHVRTISINCAQIAGDAHNRKARDKLYVALQKRYGFFVRGETKITNAKLSFEDTGFGTPQAPIWLTAISYLDVDEDLYAGYIKGDDIWHVISKLRSAFKAIKSITHRTGSLRLPLEWESKSDVIRYLKRCRLLNSTWYCELPKGNRSCRKCDSCIAHLLGLERIRLKGQDTKSVTKVSQKCKI